jgi:hypothetical protein
MRKLKKYRRQTTRTLCRSLLLMLTRRKMKLRNAVHGLPRYA